MQFATRSGLPQDDAAFSLHIILCTANPNPPGQIVLGHTSLGEGDKGGRVSNNEGEANRQVCKNNTIDS